jgi:hypothetical protein
MLVVVAAYFLKCSVLRWAAERGLVHLEEEHVVWTIGITRTLNSRQPGSLTALAAERLENAPSKTEAARLAAAPLDQFATTVTPGRLEILDIDDTRGGQQQAFWNARQDERGFASMPLSVVTQSMVSVAKVLVSVGD